MVRDARDVQVSVDHRRRGETGVPVRREFGSAPLGELRVVQHPRGFAHEGVVVHQHQREVARRQSGLGQLDAGAAPGVAGGVGVGVEVDLVGADDAGVLRVGERLFLGAAPGRVEGVVVADEQRRDEDWAALAVPPLVGIFRRHHAETAAHLDQRVVALDAAGLDRVGGEGPQFVVARCPDDLGEPLRQQAERPLDVGHLVGDVTRDDQPVVSGLGPKPFHDLTVVRVRDVQIADRQE